VTTGEKVKEKTKCGYVAVVGRPNSGKSTLVNAFLESPLSIVNSKGQTTRNKVLGVLTKGASQIVFLDTPGMFKAKNVLHSFMVSEIKSALNDADIILHLIDAGKIILEKLQITEENYKNIFLKKKRIFVLNKIDLKSQQEVIKDIEILEKEMGYKNIIPVSSLNKFNLDSLYKVIIKNLPISEFLFDKDTLTDRSERFFVSEIIRNKIFELYRDELPFSSFVEVREFKDRPERKILIRADITVEEESQKKIIIGKNGLKLKKLGKEARIELEKFLQREVYLELFLKVRKKWRENQIILRNMYKSS
jgi:GTP-binding protein Era